MTLGLRGICIPALALVLAGCDDINFDIGGSDRYREDFHYSYALSPGGRVQLENFNGSVEISGWDKNTIDIDGTKYAGSELRLKDMKIEVTPSTGSVTIRTVPPFDHRGNAGARYTIHVPKQTELSNIASSNGSVHIDGLEGPAHLRTSNGGVRVTRLLGSLDVSTSNGTIEISDVSGDTTLHSSNGGIKGDVRKGRFAATTSNGSISVRLAESDSAPVRLQSSNGHIELTIDAAREVHADTSNSSITVRMPSSAGATVRAHTSNSSITTDFDVSMHGEFSKHRLEGTIGNGGPMLDLSTSNGSIKILKL